MKYIFVLFCIIFLFFQFQLSRDFVFSDSNKYLYLGSLVLNGELPYRDFIFSNLPLFIYVSALYQLISFGNIHAFYMTTAVESVLSAITLFFIIRKIYKNEFVASLSGIFYLFTFTVFSTSAHQNGVATAILLFNLSYLAFLHKRNYASGVLLGLSILVKAYMLPLVVALIIYSFYKNRKAFNKIFISFVTSVLLIMIPTLIISPAQFFDQVYGFSLLRDASYSKFNILMSFIKFDPIVFLLLFYPIFRWRKLIFPTIALVLSIVFLIFYRDIYLLYLNILIPISVFFFADLLIVIKKRSNSYLPLIIFISVLSVIQLFTLFNYWNNIKGLARVDDVDNFVNIVKKENPEYIYGEYGIAQGIAYLSKIPMLEGASETNRKLFISGLMNKDEISRRLISTRSLVIAYSYNDKFDIFGKASTINWNMVNGKCRVIHSQKYNSGSGVNKINILKCY